MVGGAGYYAGKKVAQGREEDAYRDARLEELEAQQAQQQMAAAPPPKADSNEVIAQIQKLGQLKDQGLITEAEFEVQKTKLLQSL
jgi:membrane protease subunit (stomatin/prohibitin family)